MNADLILCDHAEAVNGKLYINGGGWNVLFLRGAPVNIFLAILVEVDWNETNIRHQLQAELQTSDGDLVEIMGQPVLIPAQLELGRPPGVKPGSSLLAPLAIGVNGLILEKGGYVWLLKSGENELARRPFQVTDPPAFPGLRQQ